MINVAGAGVYNWANFTHGTHVAGVVAASKNGWVCMALLLMPRSRALLPVGFITVTVRLRAARTLCLLCAASGNQGYQ